MKIEKFNFSFDFPDEWVEELSLLEMPSQQECYLFKPSPCVILVNISEICPQIRDEGVPIFSTKESTFKILRGFMEGNFLPPVNVINYNGKNQYKYKLTDGCKRVHCSVLVGFEKIPVSYGESFLE